MAIQAFSRKKKESEIDPRFGIDHYFAHGEEEEMTYTIDSYIRLSRFESGDAAHVDRQTVMVRLYVGMYLLDNFNYDGPADQLLMGALHIAVNYRSQAKREIRKLGTEAMATLREALILVDELVSQSSMWDQIKAYQHGETKCITDADKYEYVLVTVH